MIVSLDKEYKTRDGRFVVLYNIDERVTNPVVGAIYKREKESNHCTWQLDGHTTMGCESPDDLVEVPKLCVSLDKEYKTRDGRKVVIHEIKKYNCLGELLSNPVCGSIYQKGKQPKYNIWQLDGYSTMWGPSPDDLVEV